MSSEASRTPAADKVADLLRLVVVDPDSVDKWADLLSFSFTCFEVPGQRANQRHRNSLASKVNAALKCVDWRKEVPFVCLNYFRSVLGMVSTKNCPESLPDAEIPAKF